MKGGDYYKKKKILATGSKRCSTSGSVQKQERQVPTLTLPLPLRGPSHPLAHTMGTTPVMSLLVNYLAVTSRRLYMTEPL